MSSGSGVWLVSSGLGAVAGAKPVSVLLLSHLRDKGELQVNIRSLKEMHAALLSINQELEETLFKVSSNTAKCCLQLMRTSSSPPSLHVPARS